MTPQSTIKALQQLQADTYALYLKTQNYHWHVKGPHFSQLHALFEEQYKALAENVDTIAERIIILGGHALVTFKTLAATTKIADNDGNLNWQNMISDLASDHGKILSTIKDTLATAAKEGDEGTIALAAEKVSYYEKQRWILENHLAK